MTKSFLPFRKLLGGPADFSVQLGLGAAAQIACRYYIFELIYCPIPQGNQMCVSPFDFAFPSSAGWIWLMDTDSFICFWRRLKKNICINLNFIWEISDSTTVWRRDMYLGWIAGEGKEEEDPTTLHFSPSPPSPLL